MSFLVKVKDFIFKYKKTVIIAGAIITAFGAYLDGSLDLQGMLKAIMLAFGVA